MLRVDAPFDWVADMKASHLVLVALIVTSFPALFLAQTSSAPLTRCEVLQQLRDSEGVDYRSAEAPGL